jgi:sugar phosphate isomerase/epimerase
MHPSTRRAFLAASGIASLSPIASPLAFAAQSVPIGLELYSVRDELKKDLPATVTAVAKMGYQVVEFYAPYYSWTLDQAKQVRRLLDDLGLKCNSTHNSPPQAGAPWAFSADGLQKAIDLNRTIGAKYVVMASPGPVADLDGWRKVAALLTQTSTNLNSAGLRADYHNHGPEFKPIGTERPIEIIAANTPHDVMLQLDVGTCVASGADPVAWIKANPGRIRSIHCKDWAPLRDAGADAGEENGYRVLFGEGVSPWPRIFEAAESTGGIEYYLIEQEGSRFSSLESAERCIAAWHKMKS